MKKLLSSEHVKAEALRLGFSACGVAPAEVVDPQNAHALRSWLAKGHQAEMAYMQNNEEKRLDPRLLVEGARTVICVALNYYPATKLPGNEYQIAWYAYGKDYHEVMKEKLKELLEYIREEGVFAAERDDSSIKKNDSHVQESDSFSLQGRLFCDTAPVLERYWAWRCGLGWIGKNTQLILPQAGSCFFLGEIVINLEADRYDSPIKSRCGTCTRCIHACPTQALEAPFRLNASKCLSYLTIEQRGELSPDTGLKMGEKIYGCDACQQSCPWNRFATACSTAEFAPSLSLLKMRKEDWHQLTEEQYKALFKGSAVKRAKFAGLKRNIEAAKQAAAISPI